MAATCAKETNSLRQLAGSERAGGETEVVPMRWTRSSVVGGVAAVAAAGIVVWAAAGCGGGGSGATAPPGGLDAGTADMFGGTGDLGTGGGTPDTGQPPGDGAVVFPDGGPGGDGIAADAVAGDGGGGGADGNTADAGGGPVACKRDSDCKGTAPAGMLGMCRREGCDVAKGVCAVFIEDNGASCDDGDACTEADRCLNGQCVGAAVDCDDGNPCTSDTCDAQAGCQHGVADGACDDGVLCTINDHCAGGECTGDPNPLCNCGSDDDCKQFDDGDLCNGRLVCVAGKCEQDPSTVIHCSPVPGEPCRLPQCEPATGKCKLQPVKNGKTCDDGNACTKNDVCIAGQCKGNVVGCDDGNACTDDSCDPASGCVHKPNSNPCNDGDPCTVDDKCVAGSCVGTPNPGCECQQDDDCKDFEDGNLCNGTLACIDGHCQVDPSTVVKCPPPNDPCKVVDCLPATAECVAKVVPDGIPCGLPDACHVPLCMGGQCVDQAPDCDDGNPCTDDTCDPTTGCVHTPNTAACDDGDPCTVDDACVDGECKGKSDGGACASCSQDADCAGQDDGNLCDGIVRCISGTCRVDPLTVVQCDPAGPCETVECVPETGACKTTPAPDGTACDDGDACTEDDLCVLGYCLGLDIDCDDGEVCTSDACDPALGCVHAYNNAPCDDGDACTEDDTCVAGLCIGVATGACQCNTDADCVAFEDGDLCNGTLICAAGQCVVDPNTVIECNTAQDGPCEVTECVPTTGECVTHDVADGKACDDGNACTKNESCLGGQCTGGSTLDCDDGNPCTDDACDVAAGCLHTPNSGPCDDGDPCTSGDTCALGTCVPGDNTCADQCAAAWTLTCGSVDTWDTSLPGATNAVESYSCSEYTYDGPEYTYHFVAPFAAKVHVYLTDEEAITDIMVLDDDGSGCKADACRTYGFSSAEFTAAQDQGFFFVVDGFAQTAGGYSIHVDCTPAGELDCSDGIDDDGDGMTDCDDSDCADAPACAPPSCTPAWFLSCGGSDTWSTAESDATDLIEHYEGCDNPFTYDGPEYVYTFTAPASGPVTVRLSDETSPATDILVLGGDGGTCDPTSCIAWDLSEVTFDAVEGQTYFFVVDAFPDATGDYTIEVDCASTTEVDCSDGVDNDGDGATDCDDSDCASECASPTCDPPVTFTLECGDSLDTTNGGFGSTTKVDTWSCNAGDDYSGPETAWTFTAPADGEVTVSLSNESAETDVLIVEAGADGGCSPDACVAWDPSAATFSVKAGKVYYVVVDGFMGAEGTFHLDVACTTASETNCSDGLDDDGDGATDCADSDCTGDAACQPLCTPAFELSCTGTSSDDFNNGWPGSTNAITSYSCNGFTYDGPEYAYSFTADADGPVTVQLTGETAETDLLVLEDNGSGCNPATCLDWDFDTVTFDAVAGHTYYFVVDGFESAEGDYTISLSCGP